MGMIPHLSPKGVFASNVYREEFSLWSGRLNMPDVAFTKFVPQLSLPCFLKAAGYWCEGWVSLPVLNPMTSISAHFDKYELAPSHNDLRAIFAKLEFREQPCFFFINTGETHYPYVLPGESAADLPHISGVHGVFKHLDELIVGGKLRYVALKGYDHYPCLRKIDRLASGNGVEDREALVKLSPCAEKHCRSNSGSVAARAQKP